MPPILRDGHCSRLQEKVTKDAQHIKSLGSIIDKLRVDIGGLQKTIDTVKNTQVTSFQEGSSHVIIFVIVRSECDWSTRRR